MKVGDKAIWRPWSRSDEKHPWYGHTVTIRQTPSSQYAPLYQFSVDDAPRVNDPKAFWFWDDEKRLERIESKRGKGESRADR